ncbi:MAG: peptide chain release factor N(5)-glutamine methyltransferase [Candidatus Eiseniibacteriota bacterium]
MPHGDDERVPEGAPERAQARAQARAQGPDRPSPARASPQRRARLTTTGEALEEGGRRLARAGIDDPDLEARLLLGHVLRQPHLAVGLARGRALDPSAVVAFLDLVHERCQRRPLQHLMGDVDFYGYTFRIGPGVLVPRPETESVVEVALRRLGGPRGARVADVGCGSGVIAVTLAAERPGVVVLGTDTSRHAVHLTRLNACALGVGKRIHVCVADLLSPCSLAAPFDLVVSNPPYVPTATIDDLAPEVRDHDPRVALDGGDDGLDVVRRLLGTARAHLVPGGWLVIELGYDQGARAMRLAAAAGWREVAVRPDLAGRDRVLEARCP